MSLLLQTDMTDFFRERVIAAKTRWGLATEDETEFYLVSLLTDFAVRPLGPILERSLVNYLQEAESADTTKSRLDAFREMGDVALYLLAFFAEHVSRRGVARGYVVSMGGRAYGEAGSMSQKRPRVFAELADKFDPIARMLGDVREEAAMRTPQDIVRLYERYKRTGSPLVAEKLRAQGVFVQGGNKTVH